MIIKCALQFCDKTNESASADDDYVDGDFYANDHH